MIIDCHVHLSKFNHEGQSFAQVRDSLLASMKRLGIDCAFVYPDSEPGTLVSDLDTTRALVAGQPRLPMLGTIHIPSDETELPDAKVVARLDALASAGDIIGVKFFPGFELFYPDDGRCHVIYELCIRHGIPVVYHSGETMNETWREEYSHPHEIAKVAERFPALKIVIAHFSQPHLAACRDVVLAYPNVHVDISGLAYPGVIELCGQAAITGNLEAVVTQQPEKVLFGTDWPICDVEEHLRLVASLPISDADKDRILSGNAMRVFALGNTLLQR
jgi:hypothetical protein